MPQRRHVHRLRSLRERKGRLVAPSVPFAVEVFRAEDGRDLVDRLSIYQQRSDDRFFRLYVVGENPFCVHLFLYYVN